MHHQPEQIINKNYIENQLKSDNCRKNSNNYNIDNNKNLMVIFLNKY